MKIDMYAAAHGMAHLRLPPPHAVDTKFASCYAEIVITQLYIMSSLFLSLSHSK
jgi:hypothetical protein